MGAIVKDMDNIEVNLMVHNTKRKRRKAQRHRSSSSNSSTNTSSSSSETESSSSSSSSQSENSTSDSSSSTESLKKNKRRRKRKDSTSSNDEVKVKEVKQSKRKEYVFKKKRSKTVSTNRALKDVEPQLKHVEDECTDIPISLMNKPRNLAPMTKEEWEKQQSKVKKVYDESTGRHRLIKGDGEILEEIVSHERHKAINKQATKGDGNYFQSKVAAGLLKK